MLTDRRSRNIITPMDQRHAIVEPFVGVDEVARHFGLDPKTIHDWRKTLGLPSTRFGKGKRGGTVLFKMSEVMLWAEHFNQRGKK